MNKLPGPKQVLINIFGSNELYISHWLKDLAVMFTDIAVLAPLLNINVKLGTTLFAQHLIFSEHKSYLLDFSKFIGIFKKVETSVPLE